MLTGIVIVLILAAIVACVFGYVVRQRPGQIKKSLKYNAFCTLVELTRNLPAEGGTHEPGKQLREEFDISDHTTSGGMMYYVMKPRNRASKHRVIYFHGGAYTSEISLFQWGLIAKIVRKTGCVAYVPIYPLASVQPAAKTLAMVQEFYAAVTAETGVEHLTMMGDSAGGGMALALAQLLVEQGLPVPPDIVLFSPWLDGSMSSPESAEIESNDPILTIEMLKKSAAQYAGGENPQSPLVSPLFGNLKGLGRITVYTGTYDILYPDAKRLKEMADAQNLCLNYFECPEMVHAWVLFPTAEADQTIGQMISAVFPVSY